MCMKKYYVHIFLIFVGIGFYFLNNVQRVAVPGPIFDVLQSELQVSAPYITALASVFMYVYAVNQLFVGLMVDKYGGLRVIAFGAVIFCIGSVLFPLSKSIWMLYLSRILVGIGAGTFYLSMVKEIKKCFADKNFGIILSILFFVGYVGGILAQAPFVILVDNIGWRPAMEIFGFSALIFTVLFLIGVKNFSHNPVNYKIHIGFEPFKLAFKNKHNINIFFFAALNFGLYYVILTVIGKKFLEDFTMISSANAAWFLSVSAVISSFSGMGVAALSRIFHGKKVIFLQICASVGFFVFLSLLLCVIFNFKNPMIGLFFCLLAPGASMSPILVPLIHQTNPYEITGTTVSVMTCFFYVAVGVLGNIVGVLMNVFPPVMNSSKVLVYGQKSYILVFALLFFMSAVELYNAFRLKDSIKKEAL